MRKPPKPIDVEQAVADYRKNGAYYAAWKQRRSITAIETAISDAYAPQLPPEPEPEPAPEPQIEPGREWTPQPDRRTAPTRPARMHTRTSSRPAVELPAPPPPSMPGSPPTPPAPRFARHERVQVLATIERYQPISRTLILNYHTGMRLSTLDAILADLLSSDRITLADGKYRTT